VTFLKSEMLSATSNILYVRAALKSLGRPMKAAGGLLPFLQSKIHFEELLAPHFYGARPLWRSRPLHWPPCTNSGSLGRMLAKTPGAELSAHPTHAFVGLGPRVTRILASHDDSKACFAPICELADQHDFSMLLLGCVEESPGFSTVHAAQYSLGLSQRHLLRFLLRWDSVKNGKWLSKLAPESPGCSASFGNFYPFYERDQNLIRGEWNGVGWLFVPSARRALETETQLLRNSGRFVDCGRWNCLSCRLRLY
jgi:aminoglycoside 3-N-acetyltransferase